MIRKMENHYRWRRLAAFLADMIVVLLLLWVCYAVLGIPDVFSVGDALNDMNAKNVAAQAAQDVATEASRASAEAGSSGDAEKADQAAKAAQVAASSAYMASEAAQESANLFFAKFDEMYLQALAVWAAYELITLLLLGGRTVGKLLFKMAVVSNKETTRKPVYVITLVARVAVKFVLIYILQGLPFLVACLTIFSNGEGRSGVDFFARTAVADRRVKRDEPA